MRGYWYLKCVFVYLVVNFLLVAKIKKLPIAALLSIILFLTLPNINFSKMMIVFFWMGVFYEDISKMINKKKLFIIASSVMVVCYLLLDVKATYLCSSGFIEYIQFLQIGTFASFFWMALFELLIPRQSTQKVIFLLQEVGTLSLGIYCIHEFFYFEKLYRPIWERLNTDSMFVQITCSVLVLIISFALIKLISRNKYTSLFFLGRMPK